MKSILEELWYGNVDPTIQCHEKTEEVKKMTSRVATHYENLLATLTDSQRELLEKFDECHAELAGMQEKDLFVYAFRLGARMAVEVMSLELR